MQAFLQPSSRPVVTRLGALWKSDPIAVALTAVTFAVHAALAHRYDVFGDELYFIVCGRHPAFGYVDQPPLVPLLSAGLYALGAQTWLLRLPAVLAAAALVWVTIALVRLLGGKNAAATCAGIAAALAPMLAGLTATFNTTTLEPLAWTLVAYGVARAAVREDWRALLWTGAVAGIALEGKYAIALWLAVVAFGLLLTAERRIFKRPELWIGAIIAAAIVAPSLIWQSVHGWPFAELIHNSATKNVVLSTPAFVVRQIVALNPFFAPLWIAGATAPFLMRTMARVRFLSIAFVAAFVALMVLHGKDYYVAAAYPAAFALGAVALESIVTATWFRVGYMTLAVLVSLVVLPAALPILSPEHLVRYEARFRTRAPQMRFEGDSKLGVNFGFQFGWHEMVRKIAEAYAAIPPAQRRHTSILVDDYAEAAAIDVYGAPLGLPPALSGHNQYFLWGLRGQDPIDILYVHGNRVLNPDGRYRLHPVGAQCRQSIPLGMTTSRFAMAFEDRKMLSLCLAMQPRLADIWPSLRFIY